MGMILGIIILFFLFCSSCGSSASNYSSSKPFSKDVEDYNSIFDRHGNEHFVDDDGYCDDCDDYHDDWC